MARVAGSALLAGGAAALILGRADAQRQVRTDRDATDPIHRGVARGKARILVGPDAYAFHALARITPTHYYSLISALRSTLSSRRRRAQ